MNNINGNRKTGGRGKRSEEERETYEENNHLDWDKKHRNMDERAAESQLVHYKAAFLQ